MHKNVRLPIAYHVIGHPVDENIGIYHEFEGGVEELASFAMSWLNDTSHYGTDWFYFYFVSWINPVEVDIHDGRLT